MAINLWELQNDLSWKSAASSKEGITQSEVNYLGHLMNESRFVKKNQEGKASICVICYFVFKWMKTFS